MGNRGNGQWTMASPRSAVGEICLFSQVYLRSPFSERALGGRSAGFPIPKHRINKKMVLFFCIKLCSVVTTEDCGTLCRGRRLGAIARVRFWRENRNRSNRLSDRCSVLRARQRRRRRREANGGPCR